MTRLRSLVPQAWIAAVFLACIAGCAVSPQQRLQVVRSSYPAMAGWRTDDHERALQAFRVSCTRLGDRADDENFGPSPEFASVGAWRSVCRSAQAMSGTDARAFFEAHFTPYLVTDRKDPQALITGYYEPMLKGSKTRSAAFPVPLFRPPEDMVTVDLGAFRQEWQGQSLVGLRKAGRVVPMPTRGEIDHGALAHRGLELLWVDSAIDAFFLQIQGSGRVRLDTGRTVGIRYAGKNGHPYFAIGRELIRRGALTEDTVSMQSIRGWLKAHPDEAADVMALNPSFVFFAVHDGAQGPIGSQGVPLTAERSAAVDPAFVPLGSPIWLDTTDPLSSGTALRRLVIAQDTGGAIKGPARADLFWGSGEAAAASAGAMKARGRLFILLPAAASVRSAAGSAATF